MNWKSEAIYASEVSSSPDFKTLFAKETLKDTSKVQASEVTMLFTDLMNSTELYVQEGDESAIGRVMGHFKIIEQIVAEERGGIVKTIGDSVMAVFWEPVSALKAVQRIQQIFTTSSSVGEAFKIKAGIHYGDCTAVNLNGRIDYFGTTVNIASRLVDIASEKEIMVSEAVFNHPDVQLVSGEKLRKPSLLKKAMKELKGFDEEEFKVKQIRLERPPMRLVI
ncbi:adenylate/guanylate cyclase domain-containing protein [Rhodohalobacter sp.]|uniref:adenylate/guanylate cyclase domain-containing protein n=1 Tax=Rhodohalobacter sp. TaxID=1974210 RepID=UPI002ACE1F41|nr:adenylate/guanylate cyclase domain-containing protein [Rhodohalobacter sp.]MDZ7756166.1 adenylate/guanylate cyclase domain-containing protein [Rhodohalobacter sp.]